MQIIVLLIDDDPTLTQLYRQALTLEGFIVHVAANGPQGIEATRSLTPDVIVLDLMMPEMSGWEVCRQLRTFYEGPILMLSAAVDSAGVMQALNDGADDYLVKPIPHNMLASRLKRLVRQARIGHQGQPSLD